jgi:DNA modification methylase
MKDIPDGSIDMILCDPPYEISNSSGGMLNHREFIKQIDSMGMCKSGFDVSSFLTSSVRLFKSKKHFNGVFFCSMKQLSAYINWAESNELQCSVGMWLKTNPVPLCNNKYLNDIEYWLYIKGSAAKIGGTYATKSMCFTSGVNKEDKDLFEHPTIKPIKLIAKFIENHTTPGMTVLDTFLGSGTTGVACVNANRNFIGIEKDPRYFEIAKNRIESAIQLTKSKLDFGDD